MKREPPKHLSDESKVTWISICSMWEIESDEKFMVLQTMLENYDRKQQARLVIDREGMFFTTETGQKRKHPCCQVERDATMSMLACLRALGLNDEQIPGEAGRPPNDY